MNRSKLVFLFLISACSLTPNTSRVTVKIESKHLVNSEALREGNRGGAAYAPTAANTFQCYFASISGTGITPTYTTTAQLSGLAPQCAELNLGVVSKLVSAEELAAGVSLSVPAGNGRTIRVFGVNSSLGGTCNSKTLADVFSTNSWGSIFEVGTKTQNLLVGDNVNLGTPTFTPANFDLAANCSSRAVMPLLAVYSSTVDSTNTNPFLPPSQSANYTLMTLGANASFPIRGGVGGAGFRHSYHFVFKAPRTSKALSVYQRVRFYSTSATASEGTISSGVCGFSKGTQIEYSLPIPGMVVLGLANIGESFDIIAGGTLNPISLNALLHNNTDDSTNGISGGSYAHLTFYSASNRALTCRALTIDDLLVEARE